MASRWDECDPKETKREQIRQLRRYLKEQVLPFSPFYRRLYLEKQVPSWDVLRDPSDLARFPFTTKNDLLPSPDGNSGPRDFILQPSAELIREALPLSVKLKYLARKLRRGQEGLQQELLREYNPTQIFFTTGRSASSIPFFLTPYDQKLLRETGLRIVRTLGLKPKEDKVLSFFPYAPHLAFWQVAACAEAGGVMTLNTGGGRAMGGSRILELMQRMNPTAIVGMPGYAYHLLRTAHSKGMKIDSIKRVALGGEAVSPTLKRKIIDLLGDMGSEDVRVASVFGFTEARQCWAECTGAENTGFHLSPDLSIMEIINPETGEQVPDGESGELVYTTLAGRGSTLLRYRTGDLIEGGITWERCPGCGRRLPRMSSIVRRVSNVKNLELSKVKGTYVNFNTLFEVLEGEQGIEEWQIVISKADNDPFEVDELTLHVAVSDAGKINSMHDRIQRRAKACAEIQFNSIEVHNLDEMLERVGMERETKEQRVIDNRPDSQPIPEEVRE
ncbi:MAG: phenylacetate-CoA ligase [Planctomycetota bacterium]|jgi:phenylacetate-CoA ligase